MTIDDTRADVPPTLTEATPTPPPTSPVAPPPHRGRVFVPRWLTVVVVLLLVGGLGFAIGWVATPDDSNSASSAASEGPAPSEGTTPNQGTTPPSTTTPPASTDPSASALRNLGLRQSDVGATVSVVADSAAATASPTRPRWTSATRPTRASRNARRASRLPPSTRRPTSPSAPSRSSTRTQRQPNRPSPSSTRRRPSVRALPSRARSTRTRATTKFNAAPDGAWPQVAGVERRAFDFTTTDDTGQAQRSVAVYLRRGRALMGIYFPQPGLRADTRRGTDDHRGDRERVRRAHGRVARLRRQLDIGRA